MGKFVRYLGGSSKLDATRKNEIFEVDFTKNYAGGLLYKLSGCHQLIDASYFKEVSDDKEVKLAFSYMIPVVGQYYELFSIDKSHKIEQETLYVHHMQLIDTNLCCIYTLDSIYITKVRAK